MTKRRVGRPRLRATIRKSETLRILVTRQERGEWRGIADAEEKSLSAWIRQIVNWHIMRANGDR